jgi:hypothetical protein
LPPLKGGYYIKVMALGVFVHKKTTTPKTFSPVCSFMFTQNNLRVNGAFRINSLIEWLNGSTGGGGVGNPNSMIIDVNVAWTISAPRIDLSIYIHTYS